MRAAKRNNANELSGTAEVLLEELREECEHVVSLIHAKLSEPVLSLAPSATLDHGVSN
jgi:hypothetical protein